MHGAEDYPGNGAAPGSGGISRGRGDAELTWGEESPGRTDQFEARALDPARSLDLEHSTLLGVGAGAPNVAPEAEAAGAGEIQASTGSNAWRRRLAPRHREAVKDFFAPAGGARKE